MKLNQEDLIQLCNIAIQAAQKAGAYIHSFHDVEVTIKTKKGAKSKASQVVTEVDLKSQEIILEELKDSIEKFDLALLTEESEDSKERLGKNFFWCIDPLDGTLTFTESVPGYSVSIALISKEGTPVIGVVYDPVNQNLYHAIKGMGAYRNNEQWQPAETSNELSFYYNRSFKDLECFSTVIEKLAHIAQVRGLKKITVNQVGGAVMSAITALENQPSCYFAFPKKAAGGGSYWDYAATACIYTELKVGVSDIWGNALQFNLPKSTFMNHCGVLYASDAQLAKTVTALYQSI